MTNAAIVDQLAELLMPAIAQKQSRMFGVRAAYMSGEKHDPAGTLPSGLQYSHGPNGLLSFPGVDPLVFHTHMGAASLLSMIPARSTNEVNPTYFTLTGVQDDSGSEPDDVCDDAPIAGLMKGCLTTAPYGRYQRATPPIEINRLGMVNDRADPLDLRLVGDPLFQANPIFASGPGNARVPGDLFTNEMSRKFWELGIAFHRLLSRQLWRGNPTNNTGAGGYKEIAAIPQLVNTGYVDAETGTTCPAVDSYVRNFGHIRIDSATGAGNIVAALTDMYYQLKDRAIRTGVGVVRWVIAMRPQLFYELTAVWPCSYLSFRCGLDGNNTNFIDAQDAVRFRDEMRTGRYLLIDGDRVDVVLDDAIPEDTNTTSASVPSGCFGTSIYFLPLSVSGISTLFLEYLDYSNPSIQAALGRNLAIGVVEGAFITTSRQRNFCIEYQSKIEPRLVLRTPWLAGRLRNVVYCPIQHTRDAFPEDPYWVDGGKTSRTGPSFFAVWKSNPATNP